MNEVYECVHAPLVLIDHWELLVLQLVFPLTRPCWQAGKHQAIFVPCWSLNLVMMPQFHWSSTGCSHLHVGLITEVIDDYREDLLGLWVLMVCEWLRRTIGWGLETWPTLDPWRSRPASWRSPGRSQSPRSIWNKRRDSVKFVQHIKLPQPQNQELQSSQLYKSNKISHVSILCIPFVLLYICRL